MMKDCEREFIKQVIQNYDLKNVFEFGTSKGLTAKYLSKVCNTVCTIDINKDSGIECKSKNIVRLYGDSATYDFSKLYGHFDLVFIDGNHNARYVKRDSKTALKLLRGNGFIFWHDFDLVHPGLVRAVRHFAKRHHLGLKTELGTKLVFVKVKEG